MTLKKYILYFIIAVANTFLFPVIPLYHFFILPLMIMIWACICLAVVAIDVADKTRLWQGAFYCLGLGILSYALGFYLFYHR